MRRLISMLIVGIAALAAGAQPTPQPPAPTVAERAQFYQRVASTDSTAALEKLAREAAASADPLQTEQLAVILERHFELDPAGTVRLVGELLGGSNAMLLTRWYDRLARVDVNAALSELSQLDDAVEVGVAARAVFTALGGDGGARELVAASLQGSARQQFRAETLLQLAATAPGEAFAEALALADPERRRSSAMAIVARWANDAPRDAIEAVDRIPDPELQTLLRPTVLRSWRDPDSLAAYLAGLDVEARRAAIASGGLGRLIVEDPLRAAELVAELPDGDERRRLQMQIASLYAQKDPEAALAWVRTMDAPDPSLVNMIVRGIAAKDAVRAFEIAGSLEEPARSQGYYAVVGGAVNDERQFEALASRIRALPEGQTKTALLVSLVGTWASRPDNAVHTLDWMLASGSILPAEAFERVAHIYAQSNPAGAAAYVDRVPRAARSGWVTAVTAAYAQRDVQSAATFLERFRGDPAFDRAAVMLAQQLAPSDPPAAARLLASVGTRGPEGPTPEITIARQWALRDPIAAMTWALELPSMTRNMVIQLTAATMGQQDTAGLESWALRLPAGEKRDVALGAVMRARGAAPPDAALLNAFSDERARQSALMATVLATAQTDVAAARRLIDGHITDARMRAQAEQVVDGIARGDPAFPTGAVGMPPGVVGATAPAFIGAVTVGTLPASPAGQPITVIGPNGQPVTIRSPVGVSPVPAGSFIVPPPPSPPPANVQRVPTAPIPTDDRRE